MIKEDEDELVQLRERYKNQQTSKEWIYLSIMTTKNCNFRCPYCFEERDEASNLDIENQQKIIRFKKNGIELFSNKNNNQKR